MDLVRSLVSRGFAFRNLQRDKTRLSHASRIAAICFLTLATESSAQSLYRSVLSSGGGSASNANLCITFTLGESFVSAGTGPTVQVNAGTQQPTGYDLWSGAFGLTTGPLGDPDADGLPNLLEYALGTNPLGPGNPVRAAMTFAGNLPVVSITKGNALDELFWSAEVSTNLLAWTSAGLVTLVNNATSFSAQYSENAPAAFFRIKITLIGGK